jgi:hypothetical protein
MVSPIAFGGHDDRSIFQGESDRFGFPGIFKSNPLEKMK